MRRDRRRRPRFHAIPPRGKRLKQGRRRGRRPRRSRSFSRREMRACNHPSSELNFLSVHAVRPVMDISLFCLNIALIKGWNVSVLKPITFFTRCRAISLLFIIIMGLSKRRRGRTTWTCVRRPICVGWARERAASGEVCPSVKT